MKFSVITPSLNQGRFIERTLESVARQEGVEVEHFVVDGGSSDETLNILRRFIPPVRWVSEPDRGQAHAVNKGICATTGEIIGWLNSDDVYCIGALRRVASYFAGHPEVDIVYGFADHVDVDDKLIEPYPVEVWDLERLKERCFICQPAAFFRRRVVEAHGLLDEGLNYCMDYEYWLRLGCAGARADFLDKLLACSRLYAENKTLSSSVAVHTEINNMLKDKFRCVPTRWIINYAHVVTKDKHFSHAVFRAASIAWYSMLASLRWNHCVTKDVFI